MGRRLAIVVALVIVAACNQVFDLAPVVSGDGGGASDASTGDSSNPDDADSTADDAAMAPDAAAVDGASTDAAGVDARLIDAATIDAATIDAASIDAPSATCGNTIVENGEICDDGNQWTELDCTYGLASCLACSADCQHVLTLTGPYCGDGVVQSPFEECDGSTTMRAPCCQQCTLVLNCLQ